MLIELLEELCRRLGVEDVEGELRCILNGFHSPTTTVLNITKQHIRETDELYEFLIERLQAALE